MTFAECDAYHHMVIQEDIRAASEAYAALQFG